jgi:hypothetical protein
MWIFVLGFGYHKPSTTDNRIYYSICSWSHTALALALYIDSCRQISDIRYAVIGYRLCHVMYYAAYDSKAQKQISTYSRQPLQTAAAGCAQRPGTHSTDLGLGAGVDVAMGISVGGGVRSSLALV